MKKAVVKAERTRQCNLCRQEAPEILILTEVCPKGIWVKFCRKCGT